MNTRFFLALILTLSVSSLSWAESTRIVSLGGGVTETVFALGGGDNVVAVDVSSVYPREALAKPKVGYVRQTSAEGIASLKPDLVIAPTYLGPPAVPTQLKAAGLRLEMVPEAKSIDGALTRIRAVGKILNKNAEADALAASIQARIAEAKTYTKDRTPARVLFVFVHGGTAMQVAGKNTTANIMIESAGAVNVVSDFDGYKPLSAEALLAAKPDVILATTRGLKAIGGAEGLWASPGLALTPAGKKKALIVMDDLKLLGFGPRMGDAILELAKSIYK